jgi:hypothetical protein
VIVRYCAECDTEFQPHVLRCSDCGGELEDRWPDEETSDGGSETIEDVVPEGEYLVLVRNLAPAEAEQMASELAAAGIPFRLNAPTHHGLQLGVRTTDAGEAQMILERSGALPPQPNLGEAPVSETGGPCPACGAHVAPGSAECPNCRLALGSDPATCPTCGSELGAPWESCTRCSAGNDR